MDFPRIPEELLHDVGLYSPYFVSVAVSLVLGTATIMTGAYSILDRKTKIVIDITDRRLRETEARLEECKEKLKDSQTSTVPKPVPSLPVRHGWRNLLITAAIGVLLVLATIPYSRSLSSAFQRYTTQAQQNSDCKAQLALISNPFDVSQMLSIERQALERKAPPLNLDGHALDLDYIKERKFQYQGDQPAILVGSTIRGLSINSASKSKFRILLMPFGAKN
jgi:hypothetical protein